jgi:hypothetical protein
MYVFLSVFIYPSNQLLTPNLTSYSVLRYGHETLPFLFPYHVALSAAGALLIRFNLS